MCEVGRERPQRGSVCGTWTLTSPLSRCKDWFASLVRPQIFVCWNIHLQPSGLPLVCAPSRHTTHLCKLVWLRKFGWFGPNTGCLLMSIHFTNWWQTNCGMRPGNSQTEHRARDCSSWECSTELDSCCLLGSQGVSLDQKLWNFVEIILNVAALTPKSLDV